MNWSLIQCSRCRYVKHDNDWTSCKLNALHFASDYGVTCVGDKFEPKKKVNK